MDIGVALSAVSAAIKLVGDLNVVDQQLSEAELKLKIAELSSALASANIALVDVQGDLSEKDNRIAELIAAFELQSETVEHNGFKYDIKDGEPSGGPYCPRCETVDGRMIKIVLSGKPGRARVCPQCNQDYHNVSIFRNR